MYNKNETVTLSLKHYDRLIQEKRILKEMFIDILNIINYDDKNKIGKIDEDKLLKWFKINILKAYQNQIVFGSYYKNINYILERKFNNK